MAWLEPQFRRAPNSSSVSIGGNWTNFTPGGKGNRSTDAPPLTKVTSASRETARAISALRTRWPIPSTCWQYISTLMTGARPWLA